METPMTNPLQELLNRFRPILETYANVHRGSGHASQLTTRLYEEARAGMLRLTGHSARTHGVVFATGRTAERITRALGEHPHQVLRSGDVGLQLGVHAVVARHRHFPKSIPFLTGGGTARLVAKEWLIPSRGVAHLEPGTPAVLNAIFFVQALAWLRDHGLERFSATDPSPRLDTIGFFPDLSGLALLKALRTSFIAPREPVPVSSGTLPYLHLDHAASTPTLEPVWRGFCSGLFAGPEGAKAMVEDGALACARFFKAPAETHAVHFIGNATEGLNLIAGHIARTKGPGDIAVVNSSLEHNSNELTWRQIPGARVVRVPFRPDGRVHPGDLEAVLRDYNRDHRYGAVRVAWVALTGASNVLGGENDLASLSEITHRYGANIIVDGAQLAPHRPIAMDLWNLDALVVSAHKMYAPFGSGALLTRKAAFPDFLPGGDGDTGHGNVAGIAAFTEALRLLERVGMETIAVEERKCTERLLSGLAGLPNIQVYGAATGEDPGRVGVVSFNIGGTMSHSVGRILAEGFGIGARTGCHCAHIGIKQILGVKGGLEKFQKLIVSVLPKVELPGVARVSLGLSTAPADIDRLLLALEAIASGKAKTDPSAKRKMGAWTAARINSAFA